MTSGDVEGWKRVDTGKRKTRGKKRKEREREITRLFETQTANISRGCEGDGERMENAEGVYIEACKWRWEVVPPTSGRIDPTAV